jgi:hypothetical protein
MAQVSRRVVGLLAAVRPRLRNNGVVSDEVLLQQVRQLRAKGASPKEIARALQVPPAKVAPLVRLIAEQNAELQRRPDVVECWSPGWHQGLTFAAAPGLAGQSQCPRRRGRAGHGDGRAPRPAAPQPGVHVSGRHVLSWRQKSDWSGNGVQQQTKQASPTQCLLATMNSPCPCH